MNDSRFETKVGLFVIVGLALSALLILNFSKGLTFGRATYKLEIIMPTAAGLKPAADVMMAGVPIGKVAATSLSLDGQSVDVTVVVLAKYKIRKDARFHIDALGFLGDQYIEVTPAPGTAGSGPEGALLADGARVQGDVPFNMQEAVRSISGLVDQGQKTMKDLDKAINNVNNTVLDGATLTNFVATITNFEAVTENLVAMSREIRGVLDSNVVPVHVAITNFAALTAKLGDTADKLLDSNVASVHVAVTNFEALAVKLDDMAGKLQPVAEGLQAGQGLAGSLLKDEKMKTNFATLLTNISDMAEQYARFGRSLNEHGLWWHLFNPKPPPTNAPAR